MATNFEVRFLLVLWDLGGASVMKGTVNGRFSGKTTEANAAREALIQDGAIELSKNGKCLTLTDSGKQVLEDELSQGFEFEAQIGMKMANALLKWFRPNSLTPAESVAKAAGSAIESYEAFKIVALETFDQLNRDFNMDNLVPIYRIRREIGDRVERSEFSEWLLKMQSDDLLQLSEGSVEDSAPEKIQDSVTTKLGKLRCYAKLVDS